MELNNQNSFEEEWQKAFENASMPPPDYLWQNIEQELDEEKKRRRPFLFILRPSSLAAGIAAAILLVVGGVFYFNQKDNDINQIAVSTQKDSLENSSKNITQNPSQESTDLPENNIAKNVSKIESNNDLALNTYINKSSYGSQNFEKSKNDFKEKIAVNQVVEKPIQENNTGKDEENSVAFVEKNQSLSIDNQSIKSNSNEETLLSLTAIDSKNFRPYNNRFNNKRVKLSVDFPEETQSDFAQKQDSKFWIGLQSGGASFNPNMQLGDLNLAASSQADAFSKVSTANDPLTTGQAPVGGANPNINNKVLVSQPQNAVRSGLAINTSINFGYKISKKWHLESGLRYLRGNTTLQSNTFALQEANGYANIFLADYLAKSSGSFVQQSNTVVADATQVNNRYEYLMLPIQASYGIGLNKKLSLNLLAGFSTDFFINNLIESDDTKFIRETTFTTQSNTYKPLNISGLGGVRANYVLGKRWQAVVGASYQQALFSGINPNTNIDMKMRLFGVNYGVNYKF